MFFEFPLQTKGSVADVDGIKPHLNTPYKGQVVTLDESGVADRFSPTVCFVSHKDVKIREIHTPCGSILPKKELGEFNSWVYCVYCATP